MTDLERSHAELRAVLRLAGKEIVKLNFGKRQVGGAGEDARGA
jgi:hypothetical protein